LDINEDKHETSSVERLEAVVREEAVRAVPDPKERDSSSKADEDSAEVMEEEVEGDFAEHSASTLRWITPRVTFSLPETGTTSSSQPKREH
jgi:hypothetical protein